MTDCKKPELFSHLTWGDLEKWAGSVTVSRGKIYQEKGRVRNLGATPQRFLVANVVGTENYTTMVKNENGVLSSRCTCPYGISCKHAVATIFQYLKSIKEGNVIPEIPTDDYRLTKISEYTVLSSPLPNKSSEDDKDMENTGYGKREFYINRYLEMQTREQLIEKIKSIALQYPEISDMLEANAQIALGETNILISAIRKQIGEFMPLQPWHHDRSDDYGQEEDFSRVKDRLASLLEAGYADLLLQLGNDLLEAGYRLVEDSEDEWQTGYEITECLEIAVKALSRSSKSPIEKMLWMVNSELADKYSLMPDTEDFWKENRKASDWSILADTLLTLMKETDLNGGNTLTFHIYRRDHLVNRIILSLERSDRLAEIIQLCKSEALNNGEYERLGQWLVRTGQMEEAEEWLSKGIVNTYSSKPYVASTLHEALCELKQKKEDWLSLASLRGDKFLEHPRYENLKKLLDASRNVGIESEVRVSAMQFLETGIVSRNKDRIQKEKDAKVWPLPETGLPSIVQSGVRSFPLLETLINLAIAEKKLSEVIKWYEMYSVKRTNSSGFNLEYSVLDERVAEALSIDCPDRAISIWKHISRSLIAETKPSSYEKSAIYLLKIKETLKMQQRNDEWIQYLQMIRESNLRKSRLLQVLDRIASGRIIDM